MARPAARGSHHFPDGTWLEPEELAYSSYSGSPHGSRRRALARMGDGSLRIVRIGIPDTYSSIPGYVRLHGRNFNGHIFVARETEGLVFTLYKHSRRR